MHRFNTNLIATALFTGLGVYAQAPSYWLATAQKTPTDITYTYNLKAPDYFVPWLLEMNERGGGRAITKTINGKNYTFVPQYFTWDTNGSAPARTGQIRVDNLKERWRSNAWKSDPKLKTDAALIAVLDSAAIASGTPWREADILALRWDGPGAPGLRYTEKIPEITQLRNKLSSFNEGPTKPGSYYPSVQVPADLDQVRQLMLAYGNTGRRDPDFRKNNGSKTATNFAGPTVATIASGSEAVQKDNPNPPYFKDHVLDPGLNEMAQFQAEYQAFRRQMGHDGPSRYMDPKSGKTVNMSGLGERAAFFGVQGVVEAAGIGSIETYPHAWMASETHFRPWFNVIKFSYKMGYGMARGSDGKWYFAAVPNVVDYSASAPSVANADFPLKMGTSLVPGRKYLSASGRHYLIFGPDGNLVICDSANRFVWGLNAIAPNYQQAKTVTFQTDGNLVVHGANKSYVWSAVHQAVPNASLVLTPEGVLQLLSGGSPVWSSR